jgi:glutathione S-transferase
MPLTLFATQRSPFSRRITVALLRQNIPFELKLLEPTELYPPLPQLLLANPLGQVPVLVTEKGVATI